ncbi:hypothetical protein GX441_06580 [bacterium]|nr:hypothetical protein [bacterium]
MYQIRAPKIGESVILGLAYKLLFMISVAILMRKITGYNNTPDTLPSGLDKAV